MAASSFVQPLCHLPDPLISGALEIVQGLLRDFHPRDFVVRPADTLPVVCAARHRSGLAPSSLARKIGPTSGKCRAAPQKISA